jgi:hypothetical protein
MTKERRKREEEPIERSNGRFFLCRRSRTGWPYGAQRYPEYRATTPTLYLTVYCGRSRVEERVAAADFDPAQTKSSRSTAEKPPIFQHTMRGSAPKCVYARSTRSCIRKTDAAGEKKTEKARKREKGGKWKGGGGGGCEYLKNPNLVSR